MFVQYIQSHIYPSLLLCVLVVALFLRELFHTTRLLKYSSCLPVVSRQFRALVAAEEFGAQHEYKRGFRWLMVSCCTGCGPKAAEDCALGQLENSK